MALGVWSKSTGSFRASKVTGGDSLECQITPDNAFDDHVERLRQNHRGK